MSCSCDTSAPHESSAAAAEAELDRSGLAEALAALDAPGPASDIRSLDAADDSDFADFAALGMDDEGSDLEADIDGLADESGDEAQLDELALDDDEALDALAREAMHDESRRYHRRSSTDVRVFRLFAKLQFDFTFLAISTSTVVTLQRALKLPAGYYYWLGLRVHNRDIGRGNFSLDVRETLPSRGDPAEFSAGASALALSVASGAGDAPPVLKTATASELGPYVKVTLTANQGTGAPMQLYVEISAVLVARPH